MSRVASVTALMERISGTLNDPQEQECDPRANELTGREHSVLVRTPGYPADYRSVSAPSA